MEIVEYCSLNGAEVAEDIDCEGLGVGAAAFVVDLDFEVGFIADFDLSFSEPE
jgi:hypothetical protein